MFLALRGEVVFGSQGEFQMAGIADSRLLLSCRSRNVSHCQARRARLFLDIRSSRVAMAAGDNMR
jgi:hypothetical protein